MSAYPHPVTWILIAGATQAYLYAKRDVEYHLPLASKGSHRHHHDAWLQELVPVMELLAESDTIYDTGSSSAADVNEQIRRRFIRRIANELRTALDKQFYGQLVLVVPPKMLGELKAALDEQVVATIVAELPKDYMKFERKELTERLKSIA